MDQKLSQYIQDVAAHLANDERDVRCVAIIAAIFIARGTDDWGSAIEAARALLEKCKEFNSDWEVPRGDPPYCEEDEEDEIGKV